MAVLRIRRSVLPVSEFPGTSGHRWLEVFAMRLFDLLLPWRCLALIPFCMATLGAANVPDMDSARGEQVFVDMNCIQCHELNGRGGHVGPNLLRVLDRSFTPAELAATMWNHAPTMWSKMSEIGR